MKKRLISLGLTLALVLGLLPYAVLGAAVTSDVDPGYNTASGTASESALFSTAYVRTKVRAAAVMEPRKILKW